MSLDSHTLHRMDFYSGDGFAFSHTPIISTFAIDRRENFGDQAMDKCRKIMKVAYLIICLSVLFFVFSCLLSIPPSYIEDARNEGVTILSALSMMPNAPAGSLFPVLSLPSWPCRNLSSAPISASLRAQPKW